MELLMEIKETENTRDWETLKIAKPTKRNIKSFQRQAKDKAQKGVHQVHIVIYTDNDPTFQEFYWSDGTMNKMF